jgi:hypothetical protein
VSQATAAPERTNHRTLTQQLAEDLSWLEGHCRRQGPSAQALQLRFAAGLVRNVIGPHLDGQPAEPLHVVVVGGAGAGKSTVANFLAGTLQAEANPQAGFTRHPVAYVSANGAQSWPAQLGFLGPLKRLTETAPASLDADVYQVRKVPNLAGSVHLLSGAVVWDCPDMTTWAATGYVPRLVEVAALADVIVYVASDERYNDEVPTQFLRLLGEAGKAVVVCLTKMREPDVPAFVEHFRQEVLARLGIAEAPVVTIPFLQREELANPLQHARRYQVPLLNQVAVVSSPPEESRRRCVHAAADYLAAHQDQLLGVARHDLEALQVWRTLVQDGQREFDNRYRQEFLLSERFRRFDEALVKLMDLLELPGPGRYVSMALRVVRMPYHLLRTWLGKVFQRPASPPAPEAEVLEDAARGWLDMLRKEAASRSDSHPLWRHIDRGFDTGLYERALDRFRQGFRAFELSQADEAERTARALYESLEKNPVTLNTLRGMKLALDAGAVTLAVAFDWALTWLDLLLAPLAASLTHHAVELVARSHIDTRREKVRQRQLGLMTQHISAPLGDWLGDWPTTGGSEYERLQLALRRIPEAVRQVHSLVRSP